MQKSEGQDITVTFNSKKCIHARRCVLGLPKVFKAGVTKGPWMFPDNADVSQITEIIDTCPSGALGYQHKDDAPPDKSACVNTARLCEDGPLEMRGNLSIDGEKADRRTLCRCGQSASKPYCDNSHIKAGFRASGHAEPAPGTPHEHGGGRLNIKTVKNGPLIAAGNLEVICGSGRRISTGKMQALCRCGASKNKPFCDGSHKDIGFKAD